MKEVSCLAALLLLVAAVTASNMNGEYLIGNPHGVPDPHARSSFNSDYKSRGSEYVDLYTEEISTVYGQSYWTRMKDVPLPKEVVDRFHDKVMAITGYEADQVRIDEAGNEVSVPVTWAYNHHYMGWVLGKNSKLTRVPARPNEHGYWGGEHVDGKKWASTSLESDPTPDSDIPVAAVFAEGNGGEWRKSFHGYPKGVAQLVESPNRWAMFPMQIDTWNRDTNSSKFVPGPLPKVAAAPKDATYSALLECPCTDRITKQITKSVTSRVSGACGSEDDWEGPKDCFEAAKNVTSDITSFAKTNDRISPRGCYITQQRKVIFNENPDPQSHLQPMCGTVNGVADGQVVDKVTSVNVSITLAGLKQVATITVEGPADAWFGVGLGANSMASMPYAIIVNKDGDDVSVIERKMGDHDPGVPLQSSIKVLSSSVIGDRLTVTMQRDFKGLTDKHYSFSMSDDASIRLITAIGSDHTFGYHQNRGTVAINLLNRNSWTCLCVQGINGALCGNAIGGCLTFDDQGGQSLTGMPRCPNNAYSNLHEIKNPACKIATYQGGIACCHHKNILLDKHQNPWPNQPLKYRLKWRLWFQEYIPATSTAKASHIHLPRFYWQTEAFAGEYDIPKGSLMSPGTTKEGDKYIYTIHSYWKVNEMLWNCDPRKSPDHCHGGHDDATGIQLHYLSGHCHAPSCIHIEMYNNDTGELLCRQTPVYGKGHTHTDRFDEESYIAIPPCLYGEDEGLPPPIPLSFNTTLYAVKKNNAQHAHYGEMASWQMRGVFIK